MYCILPPSVNLWLTYPLPLSLPFPIYTLPLLLCRQSKFLTTPIHVCATECSANLEDGDPGEADVVEGYCALERIVVARSTVAVIDVPVDTRGVGRRIVGER